jgi:hypothetical protein
LIPGPRSIASTTNWVGWHSPYDDPSSPLSRRLALVQAHISGWLEGTSGPVTVLSACAGDGRDLLGVLTRCADAARVAATLLELDPGLAERARSTIVEAALQERVSVRAVDAGLCDSYVGAVPADLVLLCGVFGNISDADVRRTVAAVPQLAAPGATVIWTRHTRAPDLTPAIRGWLAETGCEEISFTAPRDVVFSVGVHRFGGPSRPLEPGQRLFRFIR